MLLIQPSQWGIHNQRKLSARNLGDCRKESLCEYLFFAGRKVEFLKISSVARKKPHRPVDCDVHMVEVIVSVCHAPYAVAHGPGDRSHTECPRLGREIRQGICDFLRPDDAPPHWPASSQHLGDPCILLSLLLQFGFTRFHDIFESPATTLQLLQPGLNLAQAFSFFANLRPLELDCFDYPPRFTQILRGAFPSPQRSFDFLLPYPLAVFQHGDDSLCERTDSVWMPKVLSHFGRRRMPKPVQSALEQTLQDPPLFLVQWRHKLIETRFQFLDDRVYALATLLPSGEPLRACPLTPKTFCHAPAKVASHQSERQRT